MNDDIEHTVRVIRFRLGRIRLETDDLVRAIEKRTGRRFSPAFIEALDGAGNLTGPEEPYEELLEALNELSSPKTSISKLKSPRFRDPQAQTDKTEAGPVKPQLGVKYRKRLESISDHYLEALEAEILRTGIRPPKLFDRAINVPEKLSAQTINRWRSGATRRARPAHMNWVLREYRRKPNKSN